MRVLPSLLSMLLVSPGCFLDYTVGEPGNPDKPGNNHRIDRDQDGFTEAEGDCNDSDALQAPGRFEDCDTLDNDCNGIVDWGESELDPCAETVWQRQTLRADVLFVMDVSDSMAPYRSRAAAGAVEMLTHLVGKGRDTHIGVVTSDMDDGEGRLVERQYGTGGVRRFLKGSDSLPEASVWMSQAIIDHIPPEDKEGMRAALAASLTDHMDGWNSSFFRADAALSIILISNEEDQSAPSNQAVSEILANYVPGYGNLPVVHGVIQLEEQGCDALSKSQSLHELIDGTGGFEEDICTPSYEGFMSGLGQLIASESVNDKVTLLNPAVPDTVRVSIREEGNPGTYPWVGQIALSTDGLTVFFLETLPPAGTDIQIEYRKQPTPPTR